MTNWQIAVEKLGLRADKAMAKCPCHADRVASLSVKRSGDDVLVHCFGGCDGVDVRRALGLTFSPNADRAPRRELQAPVLEAVHQYTNLAGDVVAEKRKIRYPDGSKQTPWSSLDDTGLMRPGLQGVGGLDGLNLYNITAAHYAVKAHGQTLFVPEGEGCVDRMTEIGLIAVTVPEGASGARSAYESLWRWDAFPHGAHVVLLPDNDPAGAKHAARLADVLADRFTLSILHLPGLGHKEDVADWIKAKRADAWPNARIAAELTHLAAHACPVPPADVAPDDAEAWHERAGILEYDAGFPRAYAERAATAQVRQAETRLAHALTPAERLMLASTDPKLREIYASLI